MHAGAPVPVDGMAKLVNTSLLFQSGAREWEIYLCSMGVIIGYKPT